MRRILLVIPVLFLTLTLYSQSIGRTASAVTASTTSSVGKKADLKIYPNPASNFIQLNTTAGVSAIIVYNLVGRKIKQFATEKGKSYPIRELPKGMYLVQLLDLNGKVVTTQRMSKR